jgi:drug/metabolite transporter (DMT)-like permease
MERERILQGSLYMTAGFFFIALSGAFLKAATEFTSSVWVILIAYLLAGLIQLILISKEGFSFLKTKRIGGHFGRAIFGALSTLFYVIALNHISLLNATLLLNTAPLFVPIFAIFLLRTKAPLRTWGFLGLGFIGVILILKPQLISLQNAGNLIGLASGIIQALAFIFVKMLTTTEPVKRINFYFFFLSSCLLLPFVFLTGKAPSFHGWIWALCAGVMSFLAQFFIVKGYQLADASHVGAFQYASVIFSGIIGWIIWNQQPVLHEIIGTLFVILGGVLTIIFYKTKSLP